MTDAPDPIVRVRDMVSGIEGGALLLHTDLQPLRLVRRGVPIQRQMDDIVDALLEGAGGRALLFPTFNYDYCRSRVYDPLNDRCQVGAVNECVRTSHPGARTLTPVFNFAIPNDVEFPLEPVEDPFSESSAFGELVRRDGSVVFFGAGFSANTFVHFLEEIADIGYRYRKPFDGRILRDGREEEIRFGFRVRPSEEGVVEYDWNRLERELGDVGILRAIPFGDGVVSWFPVRSAIAHWRRRLGGDELFFLTDRSRILVERMRRELGWPLRFGLPGCG